MMEHGNNLLFINNDDSNIYSLDLETGNVVEKWEMGKNSVVDCFDEQKMKYGNCLVGIGENEIYRIDPRTKEKKVSTTKNENNNSNRHENNNNNNRYENNNNNNRYENNSLHDNNNRYENNNGLHDNNNNKGLNNNTIYDNNNNNRYEINNTIYDNNRYMNNRYENNNSSNILNRKISLNINNSLNRNNIYNDNTVRGFSRDNLILNREGVIQNCNSYKTKVGFTTGNSTSTGDIAIANDKGEIRLYDKIEKRAKTLLKGFGDKIYAIDITTNGRFVVGTCERYLLFYDLSPSKKNNEINIPENSYSFKNTILSKDSTRIPIKLSLKPEHAKHIKTEIKFTNARFSTDNLEKCIVTSTGEYVITWILSNIMAGDIYNYSVKKVGGKVIADEYGRGTCEKIVVALEKDIKVVDTTKMRKRKKRDTEEY
jgi:hypothetical protein